MFGSMNRSMHGSLDRSMHGSLRDEVEVLRRKVKELQNVKTESEQLRKDFARVQGEKANLEMDFMKELNALARENALVLEEYEGRITESEKVNRALNDQLLTSSTKDKVAQEICEIKSKHEAELSKLQKSHKDETVALQRELNLAQKQGNDFKSTIESKHEVELLKLQKSYKDETEALQRELNLAQKQGNDFKSTIQSKHEVELSKLRKSYKDETEALQKELNLAQKELSLTQEKENDLKSTIQSKHEVELLMLERAHKDEKVALQQELSRAQQQENNLKSTINQTKQQLNAKEVEIASLQCTVNKLQSDTTPRTMPRNDAGDKECRDLKSKLTAVNKANSELKIKQKDLVREHQSKEKEYHEKIKTLEDQVTSYKRDLSVTKSQLSNVESSLEEERKTKEAMSRDWRQKLERESSELRSLCESVQVENYKSKQNQEKLDKENKNLIEFNKKLQKEVQTLQSSTNQSNKTAQRQGPAKDLSQQSHELLEQRNKEIQQLKKENHELITCKQSLETEFKLLKDKLHTLKTQMTKDEVSPPVLEAEIPQRRLSKAADRPWNRNLRKITIKSSNADEEEVTDPELSQKAGEMPAEERDSYETRTTQIIKKLEENLKREGAHKQTFAAGLKSRKQTSGGLEHESNTSSSDPVAAIDSKVVESLKMENSSLTEEIDEMKKKLEKEQEIVETLRSEVADLKASCLKKNLPPQSPKMSSIPLYGRPVKQVSKQTSSANQDDQDSAKLTQEACHDKNGHPESKSSLSSRRKTTPPTALVLPPTRSSSLPSRSQSPHNQSRLPPTPTSTVGVPPPSPRTPVREFVQKFERRISTNLPLLPLDTQESRNNKQEPPSIKRTAGDSSLESPFSVDEVDELKRTLKIERKQLQEAEEELSRQCDINSSLMKDMNALTIAAEESRMKDSNQFEKKCFEGEKEIQKLSSEITKLKLQIRKQDEKTVTVDKKEMEQLKLTVEKLKKQLSESETSLKNFQERNRALHKVVESLQAQVKNLNEQLDEATELKSSISDDFDQKRRADQDEIERLHDRVTLLSEQLLELENLQSQIRNLKKQLEESNKLKITMSDDFERKSKANQEEIKRLHGRVSSLSAQLLEADATKSQLTARQADFQTLDRRFEELQTKLADSEKSKIEVIEERDTTREKLNSVQNEFGALQNLVQETLKPQLVALEAKLVESEAARKEILKEHREAKGKLSTESEAVLRLEARVTELNAKVQEVEERNDRESSEHERTKSADRKEIERLRSKNCADMEEIDRLKVELKKLSSELEEAAVNKNWGNREELDKLQLQVDQKVKEFQKMRGEDKEQIERLRAQVEALRQELSDTLEQVEDYKKKMEEKEGVEAAVEEMSKLNQKSFEERLNKLQSDLNRSNENEKFQIKRIEELEAELNEIKIDCDAEADELRRGVDLKDKTIADLVKEKDQLVLSMNSMTSSRKSELEELQVELMEMSTKAANQAREMHSLRQQIADSGFCQEDVESLRIQVRELGDQLVEREDIRMNEKTALEVENSDLRQRLRGATLDCQAAEEKLRDSLADKGSSKTVQILRERNAALKYEVEKLTKKLKKMTVNSKIAEQQQHHRQQQEEFDSARFMI